MRIYSALIKNFHPLDVFYPDAECIVAREGTELHAPAILIIHGGGDIHPSLYGRNNDASYVGHVPSVRDMQEVKLYLAAKELGIPILGICRGAQLACAMEGGILVQDVDNHHGSHRVQLENGKVVMTNSIHHQMMYPWKVEHKLLGWSAIPRSTSYRGISEEELAAWPRKEYEDGKDAEEGVIEPEIVFFPQSKCLAVQGHPEMMDAECDLNQYVKEAIRAHCLPN